MKIDLETFKIALEKQNSEMPIFRRKLSPKYEGWIDSQNIPKELKSFLKFLNLEQEFGLGTNVLSPTENIIEYNEEFRYILEAGFVIIGSCTNGDMVAIEYKQTEGETGYLSHDELWEWDEKEYPNPYEHFLSLGESVGAYALRAIDYLNFPLDYYGTMIDRDQSNT
ncbi:MAG: hypothetical protein ACSHX8_15710 [Opitutaceae bacterium]